MCSTMLFISIMVANWFVVIKAEDSTSSTGPTRHGTLPLNTATDCTKYTSFNGTLECTFCKNGTFACVGDGDYSAMINYCSTSAGMLSIQQMFD